MAQRLNWLRAGVLGANDGIVSVAAIVVGVAGATAATGTILTAGLAALVGGMVSTALGEYVSVSSQRDSERALIAKEKRELHELPDQELAGLYQAKGLSEQGARQVARELTDHDVLAAHLSAELDFDLEDVVSPWNAASASAVSFAVGGLLPLAAILLPPQPWRVPTTFVAVLVALAITGSLGAYLGGAPRGRATIRTLIGGAAAYGIGVMLHTNGVG